MAVYERRYRRYTGQPTPDIARWWVIPRYAFREVFRSRFFTSFYVLGFVPMLFGIFAIYLHTNADLLDGGMAEFAASLEIDRWTYRYFFAAQALFASIVAIVTVPPLLYADIVGGGLPLFLSRPLSRWQYLSGKLAVPVIVLSAVTWVPGLFLFCLQSWLTGGGWFFENLATAFAILLASAALIAEYSLLGLAISATVRSKTWARATFVIVYFLSSGVADLINITLGTQAANVLDIANVLNAIFLHVFGESSAAPMPLWRALISVGVVCGVSILVLNRKVRAYEVVK